MSNMKKWILASRLIWALPVAFALLVIWMQLPEDFNRPSLHPPKLVAATSKTCTILLPESGPYKEAVIWEPGTYCIGADFWQRRLHGAGHSGPAPYRHLVAVKASDVTIDLANHTLHTDGHSSGIVERIIPKNENDDSPSSKYGLRRKNITIRNGVIDLRGLGTGVSSVDKWHMYDINQAIPDGLTGYQKTGIVLENLLIKTDNVGIILEGDGNIIRNCIIESSGNAAIMMAGPNGRITNNTIVLKDPFIPTWLANDSSKGPISIMMETSRYRKMPRAAIVLHQASGTVIVGNRIEVEGKSASRHNIYVTDASKDVRIEGNTIVGFDDPVTLLNGSTATMKDNVFENKKESRSFFQ